MGNEEENKCCRKRTRVTSYELLEASVLTGRFFVWLLAELDATYVQKNAILV